MDREQNRARKAYRRPSPELRVHYLHVLPTVMEKYSSKYYGHKNIY
jgi:hypothetical protein